MKTKEVVGFFLCTMLTVSVAEAQHHAVYHTRHHSALSAFPYRGVWVFSDDPGRVALTVRRDQATFCEEHTKSVHVDGKSLVLLTTLGEEYVFTPLAGGSRMKWQNTVNARGIARAPGLLVRKDR